MTKPIFDDAFTVRLDVPYEQARARTEAALREQGFGVITEIDLRATFKAKLDLDFRKYAILGACNPHLASRALGAELLVGLLLPCNVIVYEDEDGSGATVSLIDPIGMIGGSLDGELAAVAHEARARLASVAEALTA